MLAGPMREFDAAHEVTRLGEGRDPVTLDEHRVPADVIDMEVRADDRVDRLPCIAGRRQISEKARLEPVPGRDAPLLLVVAEAVSTTIRRWGVSTTNAWMLILSRPRSSAKSGRSHPIGMIVSGVACGRINRLPPVTSSSTIFVTVTSPIRHFIMPPHHANDFGAD
jgi:hypothetical protein